MQASHIVAIHRRGIFSLEEAQQLLPIVRKITQEYSQKADILISRLEGLPMKSDLVREIEEQVNELIGGWHQKIKKLGALPKGLWIVDFDAGDGYFCWKFPETEIAYWHTYEDGFTKRRPLSERGAPEVMRDFLSEVNGSSILSSL